MQGISASIIWNNNDAYITPKSTMHLTVPITDNFDPSAKRTF